MICPPQIYLIKEKYNLTEERDCGMGEQLSLTHSKFFSLFFGNSIGSPTPYLLFKDSGGKVFTLGDRAFVMQP